MTERTGSFALLAVEAQRLASGSDDGRVPDAVEGALLVLLGFLLGAIWETARGARQRRQRDRAVVAAVLDDIETNKEFADSNLQVLGRELEILEKGKLVVGPLWLFVSDFWGLVRLNIPRALARDPSLLTEAKIVARRSEAVNEMMKSRENYRVNNQALSGFTDAMAVYDRSIREEITTLQSHLAKLEVGLAAASGWRNVIDVRRLRRGGEPDAGGASHNPARIERRESGLRR